MQFSQFTVKKTPKIHHIDLFYFSHSQEECKENARKMVELKIYIGCISLGISCFWKKQLRNENYSLKKNMA